MKQLLAWLAGLFGGGKKKPPVIVVPPVEQPKPKNVWPDRRPIGMIMVGNWRNPAPPESNNWYLQGAYDFADLRTQLMAHADASVANMKNLNAQGMITWDIEGQRFPHPITYIGSPQLLPILAKEMDVLADEYFAKFKGFRTGICIRPTVIQNLDTWPGHFVTNSDLEVYVSKVEYAIKRWGCSIFYVDSNKSGIPGTNNTNGDGPVCEVKIFIELKKLFPDCLFIPEHYTPEYFQHVPIWARGPHMEPGAVVVGMVSGDQPIKDFVKAGNIPLFEAWHTTDMLERIKAAYQ